MRKSDLNNKASLSVGWMSGSNAAGVINFRSDKEKFYAMEQLKAS